MKKLVSAFFLIFLASCSQKEKATVPQDKMVDVIYDLTLSSSARNTSNRRDSVQYIVSYESVLKKYGLDSLQFVKAQDAYRKNPETFAAIYDSVNNRLRKELEAIRAEKPDADTEESPTINLRKLPLYRNKAE